eukprot:COSAG02_NODE_35643_length_465_cov_1.158470_1_plen_48_part_10
MQALAPSLGGEIWRPVGCSRPGVATSSRASSSPTMRADMLGRSMLLYC